MAKNKDVNQFWSYHNIRSLETIAKIGDLQSARKLAIYHNKLVRESNARLKVLQEAGITRYAYEKAMSYIKPNFGEEANYYKLSTELKKDKMLSKDGRYETMRRQILSMQRFLSYETSTVEGVQRVELRRLDAAAEKWFKDENGNYTASREEIEEFLRLLGNDAIRKTILGEAEAELNGVQFSSGELVEAIKIMYNQSNGDVELIKDAFRKYRIEKAKEANMPYYQPKFYYDELIDYLKTGDETKLNG